MFEARKSVPLSFFGRMLYNTLGGEGMVPTIIGAVIGMAIWIGLDRLEEKSRDAAKIAKILLVLFGIVLAFIFFA